MGYALELFIEQNISYEFICPICQDVLHEVTMLYPCEHVFCKSCIDEWQTTSRTCPSDRQDIDSLKKPPRVFINLLNNLQLHCPYSPAGCTVVTKLGDLQDHDDRCEFNPENHKDCVGGCGATVKKCEVKTHNCVTYLKEVLRQTKEELEMYKSGASGQMTTAAGPPAAKRVRNDPAPGRPDNDKVIAARNTSPSPQIVTTTRSNISQLVYDKLIKIVGEELSKSGIDRTATSSSSILSNPNLTKQIKERLRTGNYGEWKIAMYEKINLVEHLRVMKSIRETEKSRLGLNVCGVTMLLWKA